MTLTPQEPKPKTATKKAANKPKGIVVIKREAIAAERKLIKQLKSERRARKNLIKQAKMRIKAAKLIYKSHIV